MLIEDLKTFGLFQDLDEIGVLKLMQFARIKRFRAGGSIYPAGGLWSGILYCLSGEMTIAGKNEAGEDFEDSLMPGEFIGETTLFGDVEERSLAVTAKTDVISLWINTLEYRRLQNSGPMELTKLLLRLIIDLSGTFRSKNQQFGSLKKELDELQKAKI